MATAEAVQRTGKRKQRLVRVGKGFASEAAFRGKLRGNTGSMDELIRAGDGLKVKPQFDQQGNPKPFLPSEPWIDTYFIEFTDRDPDGKELFERYYDKNTPKPAKLGPNMVTCQKCGRLTPPQALEAPWVYPNRKNAAYELLAALSPAIPARVAELATDLEMDLARGMKLLERLRRAFGILIFRDSEGEDWVSIPQRHKARVATAAEAYWNRLEHGSSKPVYLPAVCSDCRAPRDHRFYGKSASAAVARRIWERHAPPMNDVNGFLKPESKSSLRNEIKRV